MTTIAAEWIKNKKKQRIYAVSHAKAVVRGNSTVDKDLTNLETKFNKGSTNVEYLTLSELSAVAVMKYIREKWSEYGRGQSEFSFNFMVNNANWYSGSMYSDTTDTWWGIVQERNDNINSIKTYQYFGTPSTDSVTYLCAEADLETLKKSVSDGKSAIASAITAKGVSTASDATFATMATNITTMGTNQYNAGVTATKKGTAVAADVLTGKTFTNSSGVEIVGAMANQGARTKLLNCGGTYTIPKGYHNGSGIVTASSLASQTDATAGAGHILSGKTAWVKGSKLTGAMTNRGALNWNPSSSTTYTVPAGYYSGGTLNSANAYNAGYSAGLTDGKAECVLRRVNLGTVLFRITNADRSPQTRTISATIVSGYQYLSAENFAIYSLSTAVADAESVSGITISYNPNTGVVSVTLTGTNDYSAPTYMVGICCFSVG